MKAISRTLATALAAGTLVVTVHAQEPPASAFARLPAVESPALSPDGSRIAQLEHDESGTHIVVRSVPDFASLVRMDTLATRVRGVRWADDDILVVIATGPGPRETTYLLGINLADGNRVVKLLRLREGAHTRVGPDLDTSPFLTPRIVGREPASGRLLVVVGDFLVSADTRTDGYDVVASGTQDTRDWVIDDAGAPVVRIDYSDRRRRFDVLAPRGSQWEIVATAAAAIPIMRIPGVDAAGNLIVRTELPDTGRFGLYVLALDTGELERTYHLDDRYDIGEVARDPHSNRVVGAMVQAETPAMVWFDEELKTRQAEVDEALGGAVATITSWSRDRRRVIVRLENGLQPTAFLYYDAAVDGVKPMSSAYPEAQAAGIAPRIPILYPARDDVEIPAYLTMQDGLPRPAPLVVLPHDGLASRDVGGFDWLAHFLASQGYVVVQPNFRGSAGYGTAWRRAGRGEWGKGVTQNDITDAVQAFIDEGIADPDRICILGVGYGGYAALAGATFAPDLYACAAAIAPVTDLNAMHFHERTYWGPDSAAVTNWEGVIGGDLGVARDRLAAISPADHAEDVQAPILLIHGQDDAVVPISQSRRMEDALEDAGKDVELIELDGEDHSLSNAATRLEMVEALEAFLATHLD